MNAPASIADRPKPHILVLGNVDGDIRKYLEDLGPAVMFRDSAESLRQVDFAFIISQHATESPHRITGNATVLHFSDLDDADYHEHIADVDSDVAMDYGEPIGEEFNFRVFRVPGERAVSFEIADGPYDSVDFRSVVSSTIAPNVEPGGDYSLVGATSNDADIAEPIIHPLFEERDGHALAAIIDFRADVAPLWSLPSQTTNPLSWVKLFLEVQKQLRPDDFPADQLGLSEEWLTPAEREAQELLAVHEAETERLAAKRAQEAAQLAAQLEQAIHDAKMGDRLLFTATDNVLSDRVADTLRAFGFDVRDMDEVAEKHHSSKKEDLRVLWPDGEASDDWVAVVEVKGYTKGARKGDLQQVGGAVETFILNEGRRPSARWYVVNHHRNVAPQSRPAPLASNPDDVAVFASNDGLVVDTRELFRLKQLVDKGQLGPDDAARLLMEQRGTFKAPVEH